MAITRRQFVTRLGTLAAAMGMSQVDMNSVVEAFAHGSAWAGAPWTTKPKVVWVHGAECTGCSTSLLSLFEDVRGIGVEGTSITTLAALDLAVGGSGNGDAVLASAPNQAGHPNGHRTLSNAGFDVDGAAAVNAGSPYLANIADVLIDFIDLQYHETVMSMGGDLAYQWLLDLIDDKATGDSMPFVLVVEGAIQPSDQTGHWTQAGTTGAAWCSIGKPETGVGEHAFDDVVFALSTHPGCAAIIPIGQCACYGGYPACKSPVMGEGQTGAMGTKDYLVSMGQANGAALKVINVPGCPTNPWWFILTVVAWLVDFTNAGAGADGPLGILHRGPGGGALEVSINASAVDRSGRLKAVYALPLHGPFCIHYQERNDGIYAKKPGDKGCLQLIGCKGPQTMTLCGPHGWNSQHPRNATDLEYGLAAVNGGKGGNCTVAGHPCMACTEEGYPDAFLPFVVR